MMTQQTDNKSPKDIMADIERGLEAGNSLADDLWHEHHYSASDRVDELITVLESARGEIERLTNIKCRGCGSSRVVTTHYCPNCNRHFVFKKGESNP